MKRYVNRTALLGALLTGVAAFVATPASAQATRTWVSGVGDDVNPCSRTAPCKTFAGAISKTAAGGEINCLDPGGFGAVTITKAMTISCPYTEGGALAGGNGVVVNAAATDVVVLRGLDIFGVNPPTHGIRFIAGAALHVEDSVIRRFNAANSFGISFQPSGSSRLFVSNTRITNNGNGATGGGILVQPTGAAGNAAVELNNVGVQNNANVGLRIDTTGNTSITGTGAAILNSSFSGSTTGVAIVETAGNSNADATINNSTVAHNSVGISASGSGSATIRVANTTIMGNGTGVQPAGGGSVRTYGSNLVDGNTTPGVFTGAVLPES